MTKKALAGVSAVGLLAGVAIAADIPAAVAPPAAPAPEACKATLSAPAYGPTIKQNPTPACLGTDFGDIYFGGALTGYGYTQSNPFPFSVTPGLPSDRNSRGDFTNLQAWAQKADGAIQFYVQVGAYSIPALGFPIFGTFDQTDLLFGPVPVAYGKYQINDAWSIQGGRMPTLIGSEAPFTFQNINISRGLLFNQENIINQGVQINYSDGPWSASLAGTDGFYSGELSWLTGAVTYKFDDANTVGINGGLNLGRTNVLANNFRYQFATPLFQQNSSILSVNYTYSSGPLTVTPYFQYTHVERDLGIGIFQAASTYSGAILAAYSFTDNISLGGRVEVIQQTGIRGSGTTSLLYGAGSSAVSFTITPTYTFDRFFIRGEYSHVELFDITRGFPLLGTIGTGFGRSGNRTSQDRFMVETGITF